MNLAKLKPGDTFKYARQLWIMSDDNDSISVACTELSNGHAERFKLSCNVIQVKAEVTIL